MSAEVKVKVSILSGVQTGLAQVQSQFSQFKSQIGSGFVGLFAFGAVIAGFQRVISYAREVAAASKNLGISPEDFQRVTNVAKLQGVELAKVQTAWTRMVVNQQKAKEGADEMRKHFQELGLSMEDVAHLSPTEMFYKLADAIHNSSDHTKALGELVMIMGRGAGVMFSTMEKGGKAIQDQGDAIGVMSNRSVASLKKLSDQLLDFGHRMLIWAGPVVDVFGKIGETIEQVFANAFNTVVRSFAAFGKALSLAAHGHFIEAGKALGAGIVDNVKKTAAEFKAIDTDIWNRPAPAVGKPDMMGDADESKSDEAHADRVKTLQAQLAEMQRKAANEQLATEEKINALVGQRLALLKEAASTTDEEQKLSLQIDAQKIQEEIVRTQEVRVKEQLEAEKKTKPTVIADSLARVGGGGNVAAVGSSDEHLREAKEHTRLLELIEKNTETYQQSLMMR
jgi:hypothetical protein